MGVVGGGGGGGGGLGGGDRGHGMVVDGVDGWMARCAMCNRV
jgi:hypothetical protein